MLKGVVLFSAFVACVSGGMFFNSADPGNYSILCQEVYRCSHCPEDDSSNSLACSNRRITELPVNIKFPAHITIVNFSKNKLTTIPKTTFTEGIKVDVLDLSYNQITFLANEVFANLENLKTVDLSHNAIWNLATGTFTGPRYLKTLDLSYNKIFEILPETFQDNKELANLSFRDNPLLYIKQDTFSLAENLDTLDLSNTGISALPADVFKSNAKLSFLKLSGNSFAAVPTAAITSATNLKVLDISENTLEVIHPKAFAGLKQLEVLRITHMRNLNTLEAFSLSELPKLKNLFVTDNLKLTKISGSTFLKEPKVTTDGPDKDASAEEDESLPKNKHPSLEVISFRHNALNWLPGDLVDWTQLKELDLRENPWTCDCHLSWMAEKAIPPKSKEDAVCDSPSRLAGKSMSKLVEADYTCSYLTSEATVAMAVLVVVAFIMALGGVAFVIYRRSLLSCRRSGREPRYTAVITKNERVDLEWDHTAEPDSRA